MRDQILSLQEGVPLGCVMAEANLSPTQIELVQGLSPDWLYQEEGYGIEDEIHVTLKYGLLPFTDEQSQSVFQDTLLKIANELPTMVEVDSVSWFGSPQDPYRPLVLELDDPVQKLKEQHDTLSLFPHLDTYPSYSPHVTLAYIKGEAMNEVSRYVDRYSMLYPVFLTGNLIYSEGEGK